MENMWNGARPYYDSHADSIPVLRHSDDPVPSQTPLAGQIGSPYGQQAPSIPPGYQPPPNYGDQNPPNYGNQNPPNYGTQNLPNYGTQNPPVYGNQPPLVTHGYQPSPAPPAYSSVPFHGAQPPPPAPGFLPAYYPPAGSVSHPSGPTAMSGQEEWVTVSHWSPFPVQMNLVKAMDRQLYNNDFTAKDSYVALCTQNGEPVFGRAWNNNGKVEAWFPHGGKEHYSQKFSSFQLLTYSGPPKQNFRYAWVPINQLNANCTPVRQGEYSPAVVNGIKLRTFNGELLGKCNLNRRMAWISYDDREYPFTGDTFNQAHVLCKVSL